MINSVKEIVDIFADIQTDIANTPISAAMVAVDMANQKVGTSIQGDVKHIMFAIWEASQNNKSLQDLILTLAAIIHEGDISNDV